MLPLPGTSVNSCRILLPRWIPHLRSRAPSSLTQSPILHVLAAPQYDHLDVGCRWSTPGYYPVRHSQAQSTRLALLTPTPHMSHSDGSSTLSLNYKWPLNDNEACACVQCTHHRLHMGNFLGHCPKLSSLLSLVYKQPPARVHVQTGGECFG